jgi:thioredoxin reductase (NADPH)
MPLDALPFQDAALLAAMDASGNSDRSRRSQQPRLPRGAAKRAEPKRHKPKPMFVEQRVRLVGPRWSPRVHELKRFLARSRVPYLWLDVDADPEAQRLAAGVDLEARGVPIVLLPDGTRLDDPDVGSVARSLGLETQPSAVLYDLVVVGGGPAGLTASINAASEGLHTVVVDEDVPGGQISYSAMIENYPGFPKSLDGARLSQRMVEQAERFGVEVVRTRRATGLRADGLQRLVALDDGTEISARTVVLACGVSFRFLESPGPRQLLGAGLYYGAATVEASSCANEDVYVLGGGNSAGQAALFLATLARTVHVVTTDDEIGQSMSQYLVDRIERSANVVVHPHRTIDDAGGNDHVEWIALRDVRSGEIERVPAFALFVFIGAAPRSEWLDGAVERDEKGFLRTGVDEACAIPAAWPLERPPYLLETRIPGVFAAGDVRHGSGQRVAAAVGEGAMSVISVWAYRASIGL